jgi:hypothetical protein
LIFFPFTFYRAEGAVEDIFSMDKTLKEINALTRTYDLLLWMIPQLEKFPKSQRYLLGDRIETRLLDIMDLIIQAAYTRNKTAILREVNLQIEMLRHLIRLTSDLKYLSTRGYEYVSKSVNEIGSEIGGWLRYQRQRHEKEK